MQLTVGWESIWGQYWCRIPLGLYSSVGTCHHPLYDASCWAQWMIDLTQYRHSKVFCPSVLVTLLFMLVLFSKLVLCWVYKSKPPSLWKRLRWNSQYSPGKPGQVSPSSVSGEKEHIKKIIPFPKKVQFKSQNLAGYICDDLVQELLFVTVKCGQPDLKCFKKYKYLSTWECSHYTVHSQRSSHHFPLSVNEMGSLILSFKSVSVFCLTNNTFANCNEHLHSASNWERPESGCVQQIWFGQLFPEIQHS